jgi:FkbM family methyltransferase
MGAAMKAVPTVADPAAGTFGFVMVAPASSSPPWVIMIGIPTPLARAWGVARSLLIYYGVPGKHRRMLDLYRQFLAPGDLGFDLGAHVGNRVRAWRQLGARVLAVEPQPDCLRVLRFLYGKDQGVIIAPVAVGSSPGRAQLAISAATPTVSTLSREWMDAVAATPGFLPVRWNQSIEVEVTTLDALIAAHGEPAFCKIDVEGFEIEVLAGLSRPLKALSFEYLPTAHEATLKALESVERLGAAGSGYLYNYSPIETMRFASESWLDAAGLAQLLDRFRPLGRSGDVYARRK